MKLRLKNPPQDSMIEEVFITSAFAGKFYLYMRFNWSIGGAKALDDYLFNSIISAKRYYSANYQSQKNGREKPIWEKES